MKNTALIIGNNTEYEYTLAKVLHRLNYKIRFVGNDTNNDIAFCDDVTPLYSWNNCTNYTIDHFVKCFDQNFSFDQSTAFDKVFVCMSNKYLEPHEVYNTNLDFLNKLFKYCSYYSVKHIAMINYHDIYHPLDRKLKEADAYPADPISYRGWAQLFYEKLLFAYKAKDGLNINAIRLANVFGAYYDKIQIGDIVVHKNNQHVEVPYEPSQFMPLIHIDDAIECILHFGTTNKSGPINIVAHNVKISDVIQILKKYYPEIKFTYTHNNNNIELNNYILKHNFDNQSIFEYQNIINKLDTYINPANHV